MTSTICKNLAEPLFLPISYTSVSDGLAAPAWGVEIGIGRPVQIFSVAPSIWDYVYVGNLNDCVSSVDYECLAYLGGTYDPALSGTEVAATFSNWNGTIEGDDPELYSFYKDVLTFGDNDTMVWGFPFTTNSDTGTASSGTLGIGRNSTFLQAAVDSGAAPSMSWGLWTGSRLAEPPLDGLLTVGGYDDARVGSDWHTYDSSDDCTACIQLQGLTWVTDSGSVSLFDDSVSAFQVALNPWYETIGLPSSVWAAFGNATNGVFDPDLERYIYNTSNTPTGSLNVTVKGGYSVSIPTEELFFYPRDYDTNGSSIVETTTYKIAAAYNYTNEDNSGNYLATWGVPFLTMNYFVMDMEEGKFRLAEAVRQDFGNAGGVFPKKLCTGEPATKPDPPPPEPSPGVNIGAIVGGVVGGVVGLAIIGLALWFFCFRRKKNQQDQTQPTGPGPSYPPNHQYPAQPAPQGYNPVPNPGTYPSPPMGGYPGGPGPAPTGYPPQSQSGYPVMTQVEYPKTVQADYANPQMYPSSYPSSPPLPHAEVASTIYSDTTTAVQELPSPGMNTLSPNPGTATSSTADWRGSQISSSDSNMNAPKNMRATITEPVEMPHTPWSSR